MSDDMLDIAVKLIALAPDMEWAMDEMRRDPDAWRALRHAAYARYPDRAKQVNSSATRDRIVVASYLADEVVKHGRTWPEVMG